MTNIELLKMAREQLVHLEEKMKGLDSAFRPVFNYPLTSNVGMLELINMAIEDNREQELVTRLYNLVNEIESHFAGDPSHRGALSLRVTEARETLKKVIPTCIDINSKILTVPTIYFVDEDGTIGFANTGNGFKVFKYES